MKKIYIAFLSCILCISCMSCASMKTESKSNSDPKSNVDSIGKTPPEMVIFRSLDEFDAFLREDKETSEDNSEIAGESKILINLRDDLKDCVLPVLSKNGIFVEDFGATYYLYEGNDRRFIVNYVVNGLVYSFTYCFDYFFEDIDENWSTTNPDNNICLKIEEQEVIFRFVDDKYFGHYCCNGGTLIMQVFTEYPEDVSFDVFDFVMPSEIK